MDQARGRTSRSLSALALALALSVAPGLAAADIPPPPDFVETCTVAIQQEQGGGSCERVETFHGAVAAPADTALRARGLTPRCTGGGATVGFAVYCGGSVSPSPSPSPSPAVSPSPSPAVSPSPSPSPPAAAPSGGCSVSSRRAAAPTGGVLLALGLGLAWRRRRR